MKLVALILLIAQILALSGEFNHPSHLSKGKTVGNQGNAGAVPAIETKDPAAADADKLPERLKPMYTRITRGSYYFWYYEI